MPTVTTDGETFSTISITTDSSETILTFSEDFAPSFPMKLTKLGKYEDAIFQTPNIIIRTITIKINFLILLSMSF